MDKYTDRLSAYLDGELDAAARSDVDAHLQACAHCRTVLRELSELVGTARALSPIEPEHDLWPAIANRIAAERDVTLPLGAGPRSGRRRLSFTVPQLATAAVALMFVSGGGVWMMRGTEPAPVASVADEGGVAARPASTSAPASDADGSIAELERAMRESQAELDPATVVVLRRNLEVIDQALAEARAALMADPANAYLNEHYANTMRKKLELIRQAGSIGRGAT